MHHHLHGAHHQLVRLRLAVVGERDGTRDELAAQLNGRAARRFEAHAGVVKEEAAHRGWSRGGEHDVVARCAAGRVRPGRQEVQPCNRHPVAAVLGFVRGAPFFRFADGGGWVVRGRTGAWAAAAPGEQEGDHRTQSHTQLKRQRGHGRLQSASGREGVMER